MTPRDDRRQIALSWTALFVGAAAWFGSQQYGSNLAFAGCPSYSPLAALLIGLLALALTALGGFLSWGVWRGGDVEAPRPFVALIGILTSALLAVAIILQTVAGLIIPRCFA
ncbi:MAG: hypothetical protein JO013_02475 [Alphaproteobacteria bacterium]|nr:hypothetical protein [Alphaproteobacteria bacterium]